MPDLALHLPIRAAWMTFDDVKVTTDAGAFDELLAIAQRYKTEADANGVTAPGDIEGVQASRALFRQLKIDPTKHRPSSEALLRRALKGKDMPHVNTLVDVGNACSLDYLLPLGIYDMDAVRGDIALREGGPNEGYIAINHQHLNLAGHYLLADDEGPFGSPMKDSLRTAVGESTTRTGILIYATLEFDPAHLEAHARDMAQRVVRHCGGTHSHLSMHAGAAT
jgi:DNA/RNA-binding domain of Phe-tRNA-synthetase-like protein